ncbi:MAG: hypothetical protein FJ291_04565 [Planctomycetes bacterium]|nr:hypothetical protein [Planctomycetota bacterium]
MAMLSLRMRDSLKRKVAALAEREGVSLNNCINATLAATVAQEEALAFFDERLRGVDLPAVHRRVMGFMGKARPGKKPAAAEVERASRGSRNTLPAPSQGGQTSQASDGEQVVACALLCRNL